MTEPALLNLGDGNDERKIERWPRYFSRFCPVSSAHSTLVA